MAEKLARVHLRRNRVRDEEMLLLLKGEFFFSLFSFQLKLEDIFISKNIYIRFIFHISFWFMRISKRVSVSNGIHGRRVLGGI